MKRDEVSVFRWLLIGLVTSTTAAATLRLWAILRVDGLSLVELLLLALFALLFSWITASFWVACLGTHMLWRGSANLPLSEAPEPDPGATIRRSRTALVMPVYNEDCDQVFARLQAMQDSLREGGAVADFDIFILSDSNKPEHHAEEMASWRALRRANPDAQIFYRHRKHNFRRKSGNIADFCENWGALYDYMVVLDADSLMTAVTLTRLVRVMDANPRTGLIQVAPLLVGGNTLFARSQQFASWVYGPVYGAGLARLQGADGNYWGHNAIVRVAPFMQHCGLPVLPGRPPLGGEILSHDFVEAALLRRAGWDVWLAPEFGGSYESSPPTLIEHLKRDRRWCQGNLQHIKLVFAQGFRTQSRMHMAFGAMSYLSSPLWLLLILFFSADAVQSEAIAPVTYVGRYPILAWQVSHAVELFVLALVTALLLYGPKFIAASLVIRNPAALRQHGGLRALIAGIFAESVLSTLLAPIFMLSHTWFVTNTLIGRGIGWGNQLRESRGVRLRAAFLAFAPHTMVAIAAGTCAWFLTPGSFWWYLPLFSGLAVSVLLSWSTSKPAWGVAARRWGLFQVPSEAGAVPILARLDDILRERGATDSAGRTGDAATVSLQTA